MAGVWLIGFDDGPATALRKELGAAGHTASVASPEALGAPSSTDVPDVALVRPHRASAAGLARVAQAHSPSTAVVLVLPPEQAQEAELAFEAGAADVCLEPLVPGAAAILVGRLVREQRSRARLDYLDSQAGREAQLDQVIGASASMRELLERIGRIARRSALGPPLSLLLTGETGTGKGLLARVLHFASRRRQGPFVEINCAAVPATLLEAELFGHERGAFTDARGARVGLVEAAHNGTLFLDEVTCLPPEGQAKLLTVLETRRVRRLGGSEERTVDIQVIAATCQDVHALVARGEFRPELLHRLTGIWFRLPPLRDREDDAVLLAERLLTKVCRDYHLPPKRLGEGARKAIRAHPWPGNVRELYHAIERAVLLEEGEEVQAADLALGPAPAQLQTDAQGAVRVSLPAGGLALADVERAVIEQALRAERGNVTRAAQLLRVTRDTLRSRIERLGIDASAFDRS